MSYRSKRRTIEDFKDLTFVSIIGSPGDPELDFITNTGRTFRMYHSQDCCESVYLEDVIGDLSDLLNTPIVEAYVEDSSGMEAKNKYDDAFEWTFYRLRTLKGTVTLRWYGSSNGYYSTDVEIKEI